MIKTIIKSLVLTTFIGLITVVVGYFIYCTIILLWSADRDKIAAHETIIVLTGARGRIEQGFDLLLEEKAPRMLISGVIDNASLDDLIETNSDDLDDQQKKDLQNHCCITLDRIADTTATNATESAKWIDRHNIGSVLLVTSASHMPRAYIQFIFALDETVTITPYPHRAERRITLVMSQDFWHYALREYIKFGGTLIRLLQNP